MFNKEEIALAKPTVEAIKKISRNYYNSVSKLPGGGLSETEWEWEPEVGEFYITPENEIWCIGDDLDREDTIIAKDLNKKYIPLLHWERIEEILEGMGYSMIVSHPLDCPDGKRLGYLCIIWHKDWSSDKEIEYVGDRRQEAVQRAVIELGRVKG